jgi:glutamate racemase
MNNRPIGIFDSGVGGLTVMAEIMRLLPNEDLIYFGDTAHVPYGSKSKEVVTGFSVAIASFLVSQNVKMIVVACNTASAFALAALRKKFNVPVLGVIEPGAKAAVELTSRGRIGVIGTEGTIRSASYSKAIRALAPRAQVFEQACPLFVPLVEEGWLTHRVTQTVAREYLVPLLKKNIDTLVLGCTHYPLIKSVIHNAASSRINLVDSAEATAKEVAALLRKNACASSAAGKGHSRFFVSDAPEKFQSVGERFLGRPVKPVKKISLNEGTL